MIEKGFFKLLKSALVPAEYGGGFGSCTGTEAAIFFSKFMTGKVYRNKL